MPVPACAAATNFTCTCGQGDFGANNDWPAIAGNFLMVAGNTSVTATFILSYDDLGESFRYFGVSLSEYWRKDGSTIQNLLTSGKLARKSLANHASFAIIFIFCL